MERDPELSAIVVLAGHPAESAEAVEFFRSEGFTVSDVLGATFSITAPRTRFETLFGGRIDVEWSGEQVRSARTEAGEELNTAGLPEKVARHLGAVSFTRPPDFGPTAV